MRWKDTKTIPPLKYGVWGTGYQILPQQKKKTLLQRNQKDFSRKDTVKDKKTSPIPLYPESFTGKSPESFTGYYPESFTGYYPESFTGYYPGFRGEKDSGYYPESLPVSFRGKTFLFFFVLPRIFYRILPRIFYRILPVFSRDTIGKDTETVSRKGKETVSVSF